MKKRGLLAMGMAAVMAALTACGSSAASDGSDYPKNDIVMVVPVKAGGDTDTNARLLAQYLQPELGVNVAVENVAGSSGTIGMEQVMSSEPDGYTCMFFHAEAMLPKIANLVDYDLEDFKIAGTCLDANTTVLVTSSSAPYQTLNEFIDYAKAHPGEVEFGMATGGYPQLIGLALEKEAGIDMNLVDIGGNNDKIAALAGGQTDVINVEYALIKDYVANGSFTVLGLCADERNELIPDVPTCKEQGLDNMVFGKFFYVAFPKETPDAVVNKFSEAMKNIVENEEFDKAAEESFLLTPHYRDSAEATEYAKQYKENLMQYQDLFLAAQ